jgi:hypothetical protein
MRHLGTLIAALITAPLCWILIAFGQDRSTAAFAYVQSSGVLHAGDLVRPVEFLAAAGLLLGLIATLRFSPLGSMLAGIGYVSSYALALVAPGWMTDLLNYRFSLAGHHVDATLPIRNGTMLLLGGLMLVAVASIGRWRGRPRPAGKSFAADLAPDRPLGADGLGLVSPGQSTEPELAVRYSTRPEPAMSGGSHRSSWRTSQGNSDTASW